MAVTSVSSQNIVSIQASFKKERINSFRGQSNNGKVAAVTVSTKATLKDAANFSSAQTISISTVSPGSSKPKPQSSNTESTFIEAKNTRAQSGLVHGNTGTAQTESVFSAASGNGAQAESANSGIGANSYAQSAGPGASGNGAQAKSANSGIGASGNVTQGYSANVGLSSGAPTKSGGVSLGGFQTTQVDLTPRFKDQADKERAKTKTQHEKQLNRHVERRRRARASGGIIKSHGKMLLPGEPRERRSTDMNQTSPGGGKTSSTTAGRAIMAQAGIKLSARDKMFASALGGGTAPAGALTLQQAQSSSGNASSSRVSNSRATNSMPTVTLESNRPSEGAQ